MTFHKSNFGLFSDVFVADNNGQVATSIREVLRCDWGETVLAAQAAEIARINRRGLRIARARLAEVR